MANAVNKLKTMNEKMYIHLKDEYFRGLELFGRVNVNEQ